MNTLRKLHSLYLSFRVSSYSLLCIHDQTGHPAIDGRSKKDRRPAHTCLATAVDHTEHTNCLTLLPTAMGNDNNRLRKWVTLPRQSDSAGNTFLALAGRYLEQPEYQCFTGRPALPWHHTSRIHTTDFQQDSSHIKRHVTQSVLERCRQTCL